MTNPIISRQEISRLPLQRRPVAEPGTTLVFMSRRGELVGAEHAFTSGEVFWRGYRTAYTVDTKPHGGSFTYRLPAKGDALYFDASVTYNWTVHDPVKVVRDEVGDATAACRDYLVKELRRICRRVAATGNDPAERAEELIEIELGQDPVRLSNGLSITTVHAALSLDPEQLTVAKELAIAELTHRRDTMAAAHDNDVKGIQQQGAIRRKQDLIEFYGQMTGGNLLVASILAEEPAKAMETFQLMATMEQQKRGEAIRAMEVIIKGGHLQIGDLDPAINAVVSQFTALVSDVNTAIAGEPQIEGPAPAPAVAPAPDEGEPTP